MIELEDTKEELELKIIKEELKRPPLTKEGLFFWLHRFRSLDTTKKEHKQRLIDSFVNAVYVYDDKLVLTFNYNEANTTVTLDEVNGSIIECSGAPNKKHPTGCFFVWRVYGRAKSLQECVSILRCCIQVPPKDRICGLFLSKNGSGKGSDQFAYFF